MTDDPHVLQARLRWIQTYQQTHDAGLTCRRCGISRPTLRKWLRRYEAEGHAGLHSRSRRPHQLAPSKRTPELLDRIGTLRRTRNLGPKRLQSELLRSELLRLDGTRLSTSTIHHALKDIGARALRVRSGLLSPSATAARQLATACRSTQ